MTGIQASTTIGFDLAAHFQAVNFATAIQIEQHEIEGLFANDVEAFFAIPDAPNLEAASS